MGICTAKFKKYISKRPDRPCSQFPFAAGVAADHRNIGESTGKDGHMQRCRLSRQITSSGYFWIATHLHPCMDIDCSAKFIRKAYNDVVVWMITSNAALVSPNILNAYAGAMFDPLFHLHAALFRKSGVDRDNT